MLHLHSLSALSRIVAAECEMNESILSSTPELRWGRRRQSAVFPVCCSDGREQPICPTVPRHPLEENGNANIVDWYRVNEKSLCNSQKCCRFRMEVTVHERVPGDLVLKARRRLNLQMEERNLTCHLDTMPYPLPAQRTIILSQMHRDFSLTLY